MEQNPLLVRIRKATPAARTVDQEPTTPAKLAMARPCFSRVSDTQHFLFALLAAPVHLFSNTLAF